METVYEGSCEFCDNGKAVVKCDGCEKLLCADCRIFDIWCFGCGHGTSKAFCNACYNDPEINLWLSMPDSKNNEKIIDK